MAISLFDAACARWDAMGLQNQISDLRLDVEGGPHGMSRAISTSPKGTSSPANEKLPRSRYAEASAILERTTAASKLYRQIFILTCYSRSLELIKSYQDLIIPAFENAHQQSINPFRLALDPTDSDKLIGGVIDLDYIDLQKNPSDAEIKYVEIVFRCRYTTPRVLPS